MGKWNIPLTDLYAMNHQEAFATALVRYAQKAGKEIPGEKSPYNEFYYGTIQEWLGDFELKFVHIVRNPFDATASLKNFHNVSSSVEKRKKRPLDISLHCRNWSRSTSMGLARARYDAEAYYLLKYEDLTTNPMAITRELCTFLGVGFEQERMLNLSDFDGHRDNTSFAQNQGEKHPEFSAIRKPASRKHYLTDSEVKMVGSICGELARALGYDDDDFESPPYERATVGQVQKLKQKLGRRLRGRVQSA
jgi:hypothetical protein